ncbi:MAG TPA: DUF998 domain-containing protein [Gemmatimonadaceae bacterium]
MESSTHAGAMDARRLLGYGILAGPIYLAVGIAQALLRDGFDFAKHPLSVLANGPGGWIQTANFVVTGSMVLAAAVGFQRELRGTSRAMSWFLGAFGASMLVAAVFRADPMDGFPAGTPVGPPTTISTTGLVHFAAGALGFISLAISCFVAARAMSRRKERSLAHLSLVSGLIVLLGFFSGMIPNSSPVLGIWIAVVVGWAWLAVMSRQLSRVG